MRSRLSQPVGRRPDKRNRIVDTLCAEIVHGKLAPGAKLPANLVLKRRFQATSGTVTDAVAELVERGFATTVSRRGTFVAELPPHLTDYAIAFPWPATRHLSSFFDAIRREADTLSRPDRRMLPFNGISEYTKLPDRHELVQRVMHHRLAGLIFAYHPYRLIGWPLLEEKGIPRVILSAKAEFPGIPAVYPDLPDFLTKAVDCLAQAGRQRIALLLLASSSGAENKQADQFHRLAGERGMGTRPEWIQAAASTAPHWAEAIVRLLMASKDPLPPDALIIADDNLVPAATAGLLASGKTAPDEVMVVAHANFPHETPSAVPCVRLGFDIDALLSTCIERLDQQRRSETPPELTLLPAIFADEKEEKQV